MGANPDPLGRGLRGDTAEPPFAPLTQESNEFNLADLLQGPGIAYITLQDRLLVTIGNLNSSQNPHTLTARILRPNGKVTLINLSPAAGNGVMVSSMFDLVEGFLLDMTLTQGANANNAIAYGTVSLARGQSAANAVIGQVLLKGYYNGFVPLAFPWSTHERTCQGQGVINSVQIANPAAGAAFNHVVPAGVRERILSLSFLFTSAVAVATRDVVITITDGADTLGQFPANISQAASLAIQYTASAAPYGSSIIVNEGQIALPPDLRLAAGFTLNGTAANIQAADQFSAIWMLTEQFFYNI